MENLERQFDIIKKAKKFATLKHKGQFRKFENKPYFIHPKRVAYILHQFKVSRNIDKLVAAAYLHDTLEDTNTSYDEIKKNFGSLVAEIVFELTSSKKGIKEVGKADYLLNKMIGMSTYALAIKLADRLDNVNRINQMPEKFRTKYINETNYIISQLKQKRNLTTAHKKMIKEIERHIGNNPENDIDYLSYDSYLKRASEE